jgi:uncharacterized surface protein with fasciclin (FAS1) repeats
MIMLFNCMLRGAAVAALLTGAAFTAGLVASETMKHKGVANETSNPDKKTDKTIVDIAVADGRFTTLVGAVTKAGLAEALSGPGPFTVFAPTDDAFAKLPEGTLGKLSMDQLTAILKHHVVSGEVPAETAITLDGKEADSLGGTKLGVKVKDGAVMIDGAKVIITDIKASNGIIHVIDTVMMP